MAMRSPISRQLVLGCLFLSCSIAASSEPAEAVGCAALPAAELETYVGIGEDRSTYIQAQGEAFGLRADARALLMHRAEVHTAALCNGSHAVIWEVDFGEPAGRVVDGSGNSRSSDLEIIPDKEFGWEMSVTALNSGGFVVLWKAQQPDSASVSIQGRLFRASGTPAGGVFDISTIAGNNYKASAIPLTDGGFLVVWSRFPDQIYARKFNATGIAQSIDRVLYDAKSEPRVPRSVRASGVATSGVVAIFVSDNHDMRDPAPFVAAVIVDSSGEPQRRTTDSVELRQLPGYQLAVESIARMAAERLERVLRSIPTVPRAGFCGTASDLTAVIEAQKMQNATVVPRMREFFTSVCSAVLAKCRAVQFFESEHQACASGVKARD
jgi:hypothetical protein